MIKMRLNMKLIILCLILFYEVMSFELENVGEYNTKNLTFFTEFYYCSLEDKNFSHNATLCCVGSDCEDSWYDDNILSSREPLCKDNNNLVITWPNYDDCFITSEYAYEYSLSPSVNKNASDFNCVCLMIEHTKFIHRQSTSKKICEEQIRPVCERKAKINNVNLPLLRGSCSLTCLTHKEHVHCDICDGTYILSESGKILADSISTKQFDLHLDEPKCEYTVCFQEGQYEGNVTKHCFDYSCNEDCKQASWVYLLTFSRLDCFSKFSIIVFSIIFIIIVSLVTYLTYRIISSCFNCCPKSSLSKLVNLILSKLKNEKKSKKVKLQEIDENSVSMTAEDEISDDQNSTVDEETANEEDTNSMVVEYKGERIEGNTNAEKLINCLHKLQEDGYKSLYTFAKLEDADLMRKHLLENTNVHIEIITPVESDYQSQFTHWVGNHENNIVKRASFLKTKHAFMRVGKYRTATIQKLSLWFVLSLLTGGVTAQACQNLGSLSSSSVTCVNGVCNLVTNQLVMLQPEGRTCFEYHDNNDRLIYKLAIEAGKTQKIYELVPQYWTPIEPTRQCRDKIDYHPGGTYPGAVAPFYSGTSIANSYVSKVEGGVEDMCYGHPTGRYHNVDDSTDMFFTEDLNNGQGLCPSPACGEGWEGFCKPGFLHHYCMKSCYTGYLGLCYDCYWSYLAKPNVKKVDVYKPTLVDVRSNWKITEITPDSEPTSKVISVSRNSVINLKIGELRIASLSSFDNDNSFYAYWNGQIELLETASELNDPRLNTIGWWQCKPGTNCKGKSNAIYDYAVWGQTRGSCSKSLFSSSSSCSFDQIVFDWKHWPLPRTKGNHVLERYYNSDNNKFYVSDTPGQVEQNNNELFIQLNGTYTVHKMIEIPHVTALKLGCTNTRGNLNYNNLEYNCISNLGSCDLKLIQNGVVDILDYLKCDGKNHTINGFYGAINEAIMSCGDFDFGKLYCNEIIDLSLRVDNLSLTYNETKESFFDQFKDGLNLDLDFGDMSISNKIKTIIILIVEFLLSLALIVLTLYCCGPSIIRLFSELPCKFIRRFKRNKDEDTELSLLNDNSSANIQKPVNESTENVEIA